MNWLAKRKLRYKNQPIVPFEQIRDSARTGDIILFHKTTRTGLVDALELDVISPLVFRETEFRHCGIVTRRDGELFVMECADELHSGHDQATYLTKGTGIRMVPMEPLLEAYNRDNGNPHFGIKHISQEIPLETVDEALNRYESVSYLKVYKSIYVYLSHLILPRKWHRRIADAYRNEMMCSEFLHDFLNRCGVLKDYSSKLFMPYYIEDAERFRKIELVPYSEIVRFNYSPRAAIGAA